MPVAVFGELYPTRAEYRAKVLGTTQGLLGNHVVAVEAPMVWRIHNPRHAVNAFRVALLPGAVVVWGDLGATLLTPDDQDVLPWLVAAVRDVDTLLAHDPRVSQNVFLPGEAEVFLVRVCQEHGDEHGIELASKVRERWQALGVEDESAFALAFCEHINGFSMGDCMDWSPSALSVVAVLRWFLRAL